MTVLEYIESKSWKYKLISGGKEATLETCPFCGDNHWRFNVNLETGQYICNRQNSCGAKGIFKLDNKEKPKYNPMSKYTDDDFDVLSSYQLSYLASRGISKKTVVDGRVRNRKGVLCFFYTDINGRATGVKYRTIPKDNEKKKIWSEPNSDMTLLNWDRVPKGSETLYITEGEIDMLSVLEIGIKNVVSVPNGTKSQEWIEKHYTWLESFKTIILCLDNDVAGQEATNQISQRLTDLPADIKTVDLLFYKDLNDVLQDEEGKSKLKNILTNNIKDIELSNTYVVSELKADTEEQAIDWQDRGFNILTGGLRYGEVFIFTGNAGCGKSTFVNNLMANLLNQGLKVYTHQGEFRPQTFKTNLYKILARPSHIKTYKNELKNKVYGKLTPDVEHDIDEWLGDRLIIHGSQVPGKNELLKTIEQMYKRNGIRIFFIDNLMTIALDNDDKYEQQKQLFLDLQAIVKKYNLFLGIVAHPRKNNLPLDEVDQYVVHGASEIINLCNYAIYLKRLNDKELEQLSEKGIIASVGAVTLKDRKYGDIGKIEYWNYEIKTGRFLDSSNQSQSLNKQYGWELYNEIKEDLDKELPF